MQSAREGVKGGESVLIPPARHLHACRQLERSGVAVVLARGLRVYHGSDIRQCWRGQLAHPVGFLGHKLA